MNGVKFINEITRITLFTYKQIGHFITKYILRNYQIHKIITKTLIISNYFYYEKVSDNIVLEILFSNYAIISLTLLLIYF
jgi:hypothetical protein